MQSRNLFAAQFFSPASGSKIRVADLMPSQNLDAWKYHINFYDKSLSVILTFLAYEKALKGSTESSLGAIREKMAGYLQEAANLYASQFEKSPRREEFQPFFDQLKKEINELAPHQISPELLEVAYFKMALLTDLAFDIEPVALTKKDVKKILSLSITEIKPIKQTIGGNISTPNPHPNYPNITNIFPVFSRNGSMGFNTILYTIFNGYLPVGYGSEPYPVHVNYHQSERVFTAQHDNGHALNRVNILKIKYPDVFKTYEAVYFKLFADQNKLQVENNETRFLEFKKDLLFLFFLTYELGYAPERHKQSVKGFIMREPKLLEMWDIS